MRPVSFVAQSEWLQNVLLSGFGVNRSLLSLSEGHETKVRAVKGGVPSLVPRELIDNIGIDDGFICLEHLHAAPVLQLLLETWVHHRCAHRGSEVAS